MDTQLFHTHLVHSAAVNLSRYIINSISSQMLSYHNLTSRTLQMRPVNVRRIAGLHFQSLSHKFVSVCAATAVASAPRAPPKREDVITSDPANNVSDYIFEKIGTNLHHQKDHPIGIIKQAIYDFFEARHPGKFTKLDVSCFLHCSCNVIVQHPPSVCTFWSCLAGSGLVIVGLAAWSSSYACMRIYQ